MIGLGLSLIRGAFLSALTHVVDNLKLYFNFEDGVVSHASAGSTSFGGAADDDYIDTGTNTGTSIGDAVQAVTISAWFNIGKTGNDAGLVYFGSFASSNGELGISFNASNQVRFYTANQGYLTYTSALTVGKWYHVTCTYDGTKKKIFVDGVFAVEAAATTALDFDGLKLIFGSYYSTIYGFTGKISNVGVWSRALSASEVQDVMYKKYADLGNVDKTSLVSWWGLDADYNDAHGSNNGTNFGSTLNATVYGGNAPQIPRILDVATPKQAVQLSEGSTSFDGTDDYISISNHSSINISGDLTLSFWVKLDSHKNFNAVLSKMDSTNRNYEIFFRSTGLMTFYNNDGAGGGVLSTNTATAIAINTWNHVVVSVDSGVTDGTKFYFNGVQDSVTTTRTIVGQTNDLSIGVRATGSYNMDGSLANVSIHSSALTQSQIQELMFTEKYVGLSSGLKTNLVSWYDLGSDHNDSHGSNNGTNNGATINTGYTSSPHGVVDPINYGTLHSGTALSFDGTNDYVDLGSGTQSLVNETTKTVSAWVNIESGASGEKRIIVFHKASGLTRWGLGWGQTTNKFFASYNQSDNHSRVTSSSSFTAGSGWYHIASVTDGANVTLYINGVSEGTATDSATSPAISLTSQSTLIGNLAGYSYYWDGKISSVQVFNSALTEAQIQEMYLNPEQILPTGVASSNLKLWLPMNEGSGEYVYDGSWSDSEGGNQNHGTIYGGGADDSDGNNDEWVKAETEIAQVGLVRQNKPMVFDGVNDYVDMGNSASFNNQNVSMSYWVRQPAATAYAGIIGNSHASGRNGYRSGINASGKVEVLIADASSYELMLGTTTMDDNLLRHVVVTVDASFLRIYVDGVAEGTPVARTKTITFTNNFRVGAWTNLVSYYSGHLGECVVWDEALTATEVTALYNSGTPLDASVDSGNYASSAGLVGYWRNDGDTTWTDRSTNSNDGTVSGSPTSIVLTEGITSDRDSQGFYLKDTDENVLTLNGAEYVEVGDIGSIKSIGFWVKPSSSDQDVVQLSDTLQIGISDNAPSDWSILLVDGTMQNAVEGSVWDSGGIEQTGISDEIKLANTTLSSIGMGDTRYVNGVASPLTVATDTWSYVTITTPTSIDATNFKTNNTFNGYIDDIAVYSTELTITEANQNYNAGKNQHA